MNMKTFADAKFSLMKPVSGIIGKIPLGPNGLEISIIMHEGSYGGPAGLWEIGVFNDAGQVDLKCLEHDVLGYLDFPELEKKIQEIQEEFAQDS